MHCSQDSQQLNEEIVEVGPFVFGNIQEWNHSKIESDHPLKPINLTKRQLSQFKKIYSKYKSNLSALNLTHGRIHEFFPDPLLEFLQNHQGKYQSQTIEDTDLSFNSPKAQQITNQHPSDPPIKLFNPNTLLSLDLCNLAVLKLKGYLSIINSNLITSLEVIIMACNQFPSLLQLDLQSNCITSLQPLNKSRLSQLCQLQLSLNFLRNTTFLQRGLMHNLQKLKLGTSFLTQDYNKISDFGDVYKCKFPLMYFFTAKNNLVNQSQDKRLSPGLFIDKFIKLKPKTTNN